MEKLTRSQFEQLQLSAERGDTQAQYTLAGAYYNGDGVARNATQGAQWLLTAAEGGYGPAQCDLGVMYSKGVGVDQSLGDAVKWYRKAAEQGDGFACHNLGSLYAKGFRDKRLGWFARMRGAQAMSNYVEAYKWFSLAVKYRHEPSVKDKLLIEKFLTPAQLAQAQAMLPTPEQPRMHWTKFLFVSLIGWIWIAASLVAVYFLVRAVFFSDGWWRVIASAAAAWFLYKVTLYYQLEKTGEL